MFKHLSKKDQEDIPTESKICRTREKPIKILAKIKSSLTKIDSELLHNSTTAFSQNSTKKKLSLRPPFDELKLFLRKISRKKVYIDLGLDRVASTLRPKCIEWATLTEYLAKQIDTIIEESIDQFKKYLSI